MEKCSGKHRKRRQGWGEQVRWVLGAVLAAVFCPPTSRTAPPTPEPETRQARPERDARADWEAASTRSVTEKPGSAPCVQAESGTRGGAAAVPRPRMPYTGRRGWCVDDDGVRGVRPYLAREEERFLHAHTGAPVGANHAVHADLLATVHEPAPVSVPSPVAEGGEEGEFAELARLVRRWQAVTT